MPLPGTGVEPRASSRLAAGAPHISAATLALLALVVLIGWHLGIEVLKRLAPQFVAMNPTTAIAFLACAAALSLNGAPSWGRAGRLAARWLAGLTVLFGLICSIGILGGPDLHLDTHLYNLQTGSEAIADAATRLNRVAPNTALLFMLLGAALLLMSFRKPTFDMVAKGLAVLSCFIALIAIVGYFNGVSALYQPTLLTPMALHTAVGFLLLAAGLLALQPVVTARPLRLNLDHDLSTLHRKITRGFAAALFVLALIGVIANASMQAFLNAAQGAQHAQNVLTAVAELSNTLTEVANEQRIYADTGDPDALLDCQVATNETPMRLASLQTMVQDNPVQMRRIQALRPLIAAHLAAAQHALLTQGPRSAAAIPDMDPLREILEQMRGTENQLQQERSRQNARSYHVTSIIITGGAAIAFLLVGGAGWIIRRDLVKKQLAAEELRLARRAADAANEAKGRFLANMSHEIRTPMNAIIGYADLLLDSRQSVEDRSEYAQTIRRNGEHLLTLINDILDLSKIDAGKLDVQPIECSPCQLLSDVASLMRVRAGEKQLKLEIRNEGPVPASIRTDPARLRQILINLLGNAIKFTDEGWVRLLMTLDESGPHGPRLRFDIIDTGLGMTPEQVSRLFQPFVQADASTTRRFGGTGLGLTISQRLAEALGGVIRVDSSPNRGSTFSLTIDPGPLTGVRRLQNCREALAGGERPQPPSTLPVLHARLLLVDDGEDNRRLLSTYLTQSGATVDAAENGREAVDQALAAAAAGHPFDVILMDMQMPILDGYGATRLLRAQGYDHPIIALTANAMAEDCDKCLAAGCSDYLSKPVRRDQLLLAVARNLRPAAEAAAASLPPAPARDSTNGEGPIRSDLDDPTLQPLLNQYLASLPARIAELQASLDEHDLHQLTDRLHNLKGTGGLYGLMPLTDAAADLERLVLQRAPRGRLAAALERLTLLVRRIEGVTPRQKT